MRDPNHLTRHQIALLTKDEIHYAINSRAKRIAALEAENAHLRARNKDLRIMLERITKARDEARELLRDVQGWLYCYHPNGRNLADRIRAHLNSSAPSGGSTQDKKVV